MEINNYKECIKNAKKTAMRDGYDQLIILDTSIILIILPVHTDKNCGKMKY